MPYSPCDNAEAWCRGLTRGPVKAEIAGSNPVASACIPEPLGSGIFSRRAFHPSNGSARISFGTSSPIEILVATVASLIRENSARRPLGSIDDGQLVTARLSSSISAAITLPPRKQAKHESSAR
jgi:hypothetical protein